ncbi:helix-turn-helix domain-containing protein [Thermomonospora umbrina]|uniref:HTH cro/C1-type domain-containing protein n=1 Tax=Thermomonospora umbrina TaxID=111806 RepID=A0A3D9SUT2_9ACTN|nr:DUF5753 domain-containing protein [Thermomonospora umbrina]REE97793.1 hypothetical protein DFJ69_3268 [Thermomonospora umbrina]
MPAVPVPYEAPAIVTFARELEAFRTDAGLGKKELADILGFTDTYVGQIELCKNLPSQGFAEACDTYFKTNGSFQRLRERIMETRHTSLVPPGFPEYLNHEVRATSIKHFNPNLVSGLLQIEDYARTIIGAYQPADVVDKLVSDRLSRREVLDRAHAYFTMDESVLHRRVGRPEIMRRQLEFLLEKSERPNISIGIVPSSTGFYPGFGGEFFILGFEDGGSIAYTESSGEGLLIQEPARVARHVLRYDSMRDYVLPVDQSRTVIRQAMERLEG